MKYQNYLFDFYGTLADVHTNESKKELWQALALWYRSHGAAYTPWQIRKEYRLLVDEEKNQAARRHAGYTDIDIRLERVFEKLYHKQNLQISLDVVQETALFFRMLSRSYLRLYPKVRSMLAGLRAQGKHCYLLTNAQAVFTLPELRLLGIVDFFDGIVISSEEECAKPDPHFYEIACERYQLKKEDTVMVGNDPRTDIAGANAFGIDSVYIHSNLSPRWEGTPDSTYVIEGGNTEKLEKLLLSL